MLVRSFTKSDVRALRSVTTAEYCRITEINKGTDWVKFS